MTRIKPIPSHYLVANGLCKLSEAEANLTLEKFQIGMVSPRNPQIERAVIRDMQAILDGYRTRRIMYVKDWLNNNGHKTLNQGDVSVVSGEEQSENLSTKETRNEELSYLEESELPAPPKLQTDKEIEPISDMNLDAMLHEKPVGRINPPMPGVLFKCAPLRIPCPTGFIHGLSHNKEYPSPQFIDIPIVASTEGFKIDYPNLLKSDVIPVPLSAEISSVFILPKLKVALPHKSNPAIWRGEYNFEHLTYTIQHVHPSSNLLKVERSLFIPNEEEKKYLQAILPLPPSYKKRIGESPDKVIDIVTSYLSVKDLKTRLTNFRYVNNPRFGRFVKDNIKYLPLIISELKVGHCDLLSWYVCAQLRAHGEVAWVAGDLLTTRDGKAFNGSYLHSTVLNAKKDNTLAYYDPTIHCDFDKGYHSAVLKDEIVDELERKFQEAKTVKEKVQVLREFNEQINELRVIAESNEEVINDMRTIEEGSIGELFVPGSSIPPSQTLKFDDSSSKIQNQVANWEYLPSVVTVESMAQVNKMLMSGDFFEAQRSINDLDSAMLKLGDCQSEAIIEQVCWLLRAYNEKRLFLYHGTNYGLNPKTFDLQSKLTSDDLCKMYPPLGITVAECPSPSIVEHTTASDLLKYLRSDYFNRAGIGVISYSHLVHHLGEADLVSLETKDGEEFRNYVYNSLFKKCLQDEAFPYYHQDSHALYLVDTTTWETKGTIHAPTSNQICELKDDIVNFAFEFQRACIDAAYRKYFIEKLGINEKIFSNLITYFLSMSKKSKARTIQKLPEPYFEETDHLTALFNIFYLNGRCSSNFASSVRTLLHKMDFKQAKARTKEHDELRKYIHGDDIKKIDWKYYARSDRYYVKQDPRNAFEISTPLYVLIDNIRGVSASDDSIVYPLQVRELIRILQRESRASGREIFIGLKNGAGYYKLPLNVKPQDVLASVASAYQEKESYNPLLKNGRPPKNLLFVTHEFQRTLSMQYLYGRYCNLETLWLQDREFRVYPLVKEDRLLAYAKKKAEEKEAQGKYRASLK